MRNMASRRKQDDKHIKILREIGSKPENRTCFDCHQKGPTYINMTIGSFVCTSCSGILRGLNPPHRVKSISMASFTPEEVEQIKSKGNHYCHAVWLGLYDGKSNLFPDTKDEHKIRDFMISKYEKKRFYIDPSVALKNTKNTHSGSSSNASTPGSSDSKSLGSGTTPTISSSTSVSRPISSIQNACSSPCLNGLPQSSSLKPSSSVDLLSSLSGGGLAKPFPSASTAKTQSSFNKAPLNGGFANFDNATIFTNTPANGSCSSASSSVPITTFPPFCSSPLTPLSSTSPAPCSSKVPSANIGAALNEDRYAALKDLDEEFKIHKEVPAAPIPQTTNNGSSLFGTSPTSSFPTNGVSNGVFGSPSVGAPGNFFPAPANATWNDSFQPANPFAGATNGSMASGWSTSPAFPSPQTQANPFSGGGDPPFNGQINNSESSPTPNWANFSTLSTPQSTPKVANNPWASNSTPNPFSVPQVQSTGSHYNPFL